MNTYLLVSCLLLGRDSIRSLPFLLFSACDAAYVQPLCAILRYIQVTQLLLVYGVGRLFQRP